MSAKDLIDGIRRAFPFPLPLARHRDLVSRLVFARPYAAVIAAERAGKLAPPAVHDVTLAELVLEFGQRVNPLAEIARTWATSYRGERPSVAGVPPATLNAIYLSAYWRDIRAPLPRRAGRETLRITLGRPLTWLLKRHEVERARNLNDFRFDADDHLERRGNVDTQDEAQRTLLAAARTLEFLAATGLRPATRRAQRVALGLHELPGRDHVSHWVDPTTGAPVGLDEPYPYVDLAERSTWLARHGLHLISPKWDGLHAPGLSTPFMLAKDAELLHRLGTQLAVLGAGQALTWTGESAPYAQRFLSPARQAAGKPARPRIMPAYAGTSRAGAVAYGGRPGSKGRWRPEVPMPFEMHEKSGALLQQLTYVGVAPRIENLVQQVRSELEDWALAEHKEAAAGRHDLYYGGNSTVHTTDVRGVAAELIGILQAGYADCSPRRKMIGKLQKAIALTAKGSKKILKATNDAAS